MGIVTVAGQVQLKPRAAIYWHRVGTGQHLGLRKTKTAETWVARAYDPNARKQIKRSLGDFANLPANERFTAASKAAREWFAHLEMGGAKRSISVLEACQRYLQSLRDDPERGAEKGEAAAIAESGYVRRFVAKDRIAGIPVDKLVAANVKDWRKRMSRKPVAPPKRGKRCRSKDPLPPPRPRKPVSVNRNMVTLRAALNLALAEGYALSDRAWAEALKPIPKVGSQRTLYLDRDERKALLDHLPEDLRAFVHALAVLPLRPGALAALKAGDYSPRLKQLRIGTDKANEDRIIALPDATAKLIAAVARGKLPAAPLFARWDGQPWSKDAWMKRIRAGAQAAGLPQETTAYTLRHSTITDLVVGGLDLLTVAQVSGTSVAMIEKYYGKLRQDRARDALAALAF